MADNRGGKSNRGLASADEETRQRVASLGGQASHKNDNQSGSDNNRGSNRGNTGGRNKNR
ncbi:general stress protein [Candidatus Microgenomates bacterium]|nr:general stress protein [Candidatus Microgenomates bacterium]